MFGIVLISKQDFNMYLQYNKQNNEEIVQKMKDMVPEFISQNSTFEKLDT